jgi:hypothetical protein
MENGISAPVGDNVTRSSIAEFCMGTNIKAAEP